MKVPYKKKRDIKNLFIAISWGILAGNGFINSDDPKIIRYGTLLYSISYFLYYVFDKKIYYLTIREGIIKTGKFFGKKIPLTEIKRIIVMDKKYILKTVSNSELQINTEIIESKSLDKLTTELKKFDIKWDKKTFADNL